ncbi:hypothetical protein MTP99_006759 [Tenebrio molitor]|nr:hypothetical protein MTP99_006759 [Tenebrio molitor]
MTGYESVCDSDNVVSNLDLNNSIVEPGEVVEVVEEDDLNPNDSCLPGSSANPQIVVDWSDYSPALLKAPTSELLSLTSRSGDHQKQQRVGPIKNGVILPIRRTNI